MRRAAHYNAFIHMESRQMIYYKSQRKRGDEWLGFYRLGQMGGPMATNPVKKWLRGFVSDWLCKQRW